jgi:hypothetical protein
MFTFGKIALVALFPSGCLLSFEAETRDCQKKEIVCFFEQFFF